MELHERLRALSSQLGVGVFNDADGFRAALDDYLDEGSATTGDINLLVDAVRLEAFRRMTTMIDNGAEPSAAVATAGDQLAIDRGSDDSRRSRWACAALGYAVGLVDTDTVLRHLSATSDTPTPAAGQGSTLPEPQPAPTIPASPAVVGPPIVPGTEDSVATSPAAGFPVDQSIPTSHRYVAPAPRRRRPLALVLILVAIALLGGAGVAAWATLGGDDGGSGQERDTARLSDDTLTLAVRDDAENRRIVAVDLPSGDTRDLTDGPDHFLPSISPDRRRLVFQQGDIGGLSEPILLDLETGDERRLLEGGDPCTYTARPAWSLDGERLALVCFEAVGEPSGMYVVGTDGSVIQEIAGPVAPGGAITWTSDDTLVYLEQGATPQDPTTLWSIGLDGEPPTQLTDGSTGADSHPDWSEESGLLLFSRHPPKDFFGDIWTMDAEGDNVERRSEGLRLGHPVWAPDGNRFAFTVESDGGEALRVSSIDDPYDQTPVEVPGAPGPPAWGNR